LFREREKKRGGRERERGMLSNGNDAKRAHVSTDIE